MVVRLRRSRSPRRRADATHSGEEPRAVSTVEADEGITEPPLNRCPCQNPSRLDWGSFRLPPCFRGRAIIPLNLWITLLTTSTPDTQSGRNYYSLDDLPKI
jgi:hypothetical protein